MPNRLLERMRSDFIETQERIAALQDQIDSEGRDPTEDESANLSAWNEELESRRPRIEQLTSLERSMASTADLFAGAPMDTADRIERVRGQGIQQSQALSRFNSMGEWARAVALGEVGIDVRREFSRALVDVTTADVPGLVPPAFITDFAMLLRTARPFLEAWDTRPLPDSGMTINYPVIGTRPQVGKITGEKVDIPSRKTTVTNAVSPVETYGGGEDVSVQVLQRTDPPYLSLMLELYAEQMAMTMEGAAITAALAAVAAGNELPLDPADPTSWSQQLAVGAGKIFSANAVPDVLVAGIDVWTAFAGAADADGRPLFPDFAPSNPIGSTDLSSTSGSVRGLRLVVAPGMPATKAILGWSRAFTTFLSPVQTLSADNPAKLGRDYAVFQFAAFACRRPDAMVEYTMTPVGP